MNEAEASNCAAGYTGNDCDDHYLWNWTSSPMGTCEYDFAPSDPIMGLLAAHRP